MSRILMRGPVRRPDLRAEKAVALITTHRDAKTAPALEEDLPLPDGPRSLS
jgi:hypothetical protein